MLVHKWAEIRAKRFSPEETEAIQKWVDAELAGMESSDDHDKDEETQGEPIPPQVKPTLFGSVQAGDITEEMIEEAKKDLFPDLDDL